MSNELGGGNPKVAKLAVRVVLSIAILESILVGSVLILIRKIWGFAYSSDPEVVNFLASMLPILALGHCLDSFQSVLSGHLYASLKRKHFFFFLQGKPPYKHRYYLSCLIFGLLFFING